MAIRPWPATVPSIGRPVEDSRRSRRARKLPMHRRHVSSSGGIHTAIDRAEAIGGEASRSSRRARACGGRRTTTRPTSSASRSAPPRPGSRGVVCHALYLINLAGTGRRDLREVGRGAAQHGRRRRARSTPTASSSTSARTSAPASRRGSSASSRRCASCLERCSDEDLAADGEHRRHRRHDRPLDRGAGGARRRARPAPAARHLPRLVPPLRLRLRRHRPRRARRRARPRSTARSGSTGCARCTSTTRRRRSARTATGTRTSARG